VGAQGAQGAQGGAGTAGAQGAQGEPGAVGAKGGQGAQGAQGSQGVQGNQGAPGPNGAGAQGAQGAQGDVGNQGAQGDTGDACPSDFRLKKDIQPITDSIKKISKVRGVRYSWKEHDFLDSKTWKQDDIGFIAQELNYVLPELVFGSEEDMFRVKYSDMIALCIEAIKEQSNLLNLKEEKLSLLELKAKEKGLI
jgi:hypothetical protein